MVSGSSRIFTYALLFTRSSTAKLRFVCSNLETVLPFKVYNILRYMIHNIAILLLGMLVNKF